MDYKRMLEKILTQSEFANLEKEKQMNDDYSVMQYLEDRSAICVIGINDYDEKRIFSFIDQRLDKFVEDGLTLHELVPFSPSHVYRLGIKDRLHPFSINCLKYYNNILKPDGFQIILTSNQSDFFPFMVVKSENVISLKQMRSDYWNFYTLD